MSEDVSVGAEWCEASKTDIFSMRAATVTRSGYSCVAVLALIWVCRVPVACAQATPGQDQLGQHLSAELKPREHWVRVMRPYVGHPILVIDYPWRIHARPSLEVLFLPEGQPEPLDRRPLAFVDRFLHGDLAMDVYRSQDRGERVAFTMKVSKQGVELEIHGKRNSLSKPAVWVDCHWSRPDLKTETRTVFCLLDWWAVDDRTLYLDLPAAYYSQPGRLRIWMLAGKDTVWTHTIAWPGMPGAAGAKAAPNATAPAPTPADEEPVHAGQAEATAKPRPNAKPVAPAKPPKPAGGPAADEDNPFR